MYWILGKENLIPKNGVNATINGAYEPYNNGFGIKFKKELLSRYLHKEDN